MCVSKASVDIVSSLKQLYDVDSNLLDSLYFGHSSCIILCVCPFYSFNRGNQKNYKYCRNNQEDFFGWIQWKKTSSKSLNKKIKCIKIGWKIRKFKFWTFGPFLIYLICRTENIKKEVHNGWGLKKLFIY
jgi:hypothetical protein